MFANDVLCLVLCRAQERLMLLIKAGANVVMTTKGIDDLCLKYFVEANAIGVRR